MEYFGLLGFVAFVWCCSLSDKVRKLERIIKTNGIVNPETESLSRVLEKHLGKTVMLSLHDSFDMDFVGKSCLIEDTDGEWLLVKTNPNKKNETEKLIRIDLIKSLSVK